jgi:hypothetical protein
MVPDDGEGSQARWQAVTDLLLDAADAAESRRELGRQNGGKPRMEPVPGRDGVP